MRSSSSAARATSPLRAVALVCGIAATILALSVEAAPKPRQRFFVQGDGRIRVKSLRNELEFSGPYRRRDGRYIEPALEQINRVFGASYERREARVALRLVELSAFIQRRLKGSWIVISSGYRSPEYNDKLRAKGKTVAKASLHQYGMAVDLRIEGVASKQVWRFARRRKLGGVGYYNNPWLHLDVGPARSWTQSTANVRKGVSLHNKRIMLVPEYDIYAAGEVLRLRFARMTAYPIGVRATFALEREKEGEWHEVKRFNPRLSEAATTRSSPPSCVRFENIAEMADISWQLPATLPPGRYRARAHFCNRRWDAMPEHITSPAFALRARGETGLAVPSSP